MFFNPTYMRAIKLGLKILINLFTCSWHGEYTILEAWMEAPQDFQLQVLRRSLPETVPLWEISWLAESRIRTSWWVIEPWTATGKLPCTDFTQQVKAHWLAQNQKWQPLVAQVRRLPSLRKGDSLKVCQPAPLSSRMIGQPLSHWSKRLCCFHLL